MSANLIDRVLSNLKKRKSNIENNKINSIPSSFVRFTDHLVGIEQATYYIVTGYSGGAKSQFSYYYFVFEPILYLFENRDKNPDLKLTVFCLPLEETAERITQRFMSYLLFKLTNGNVLISPKDLRSSNNKNPLPKEVLDILESPRYKAILNFFESCVHFEVDVSPRQFYEKIKDYCEENGTTYYKEEKIKDELGQEKTIKKFDYYEPNNPQEFILAFVDHISLLPYTTTTLKEAIDTFSSRYLISLRNRYYVSPVIVQQQAASNESIDAFKIDRSKPTRANLADSKNTGKDSNIIISIYNPSAHNLKTYAGYDILEFKGNARFIELLKNRDGNENLVIGLLFNGACSYFRELSYPNDILGVDKDLKEAKEFVTRSRNHNYIKEELNLI